MKIYISGKITGDENYKEKFEKKGQELQVKYPNAEIINPADICKDIPSDSSWVEYMKTCIRVLTLCDTIYMLEDWKHSKGAKLEHKIAEKLRFEIIYQ